MQQLTQKDASNMQRRGYSRQPRKRGFLTSAQKARFLLQYLRQKEKILFVGWVQRSETQQNRFYGGPHNLQKNGEGIVKKTGFLNSQYLRHFIERLVVGHK